MVRQPAGDAEDRGPAHRPRAGARHRFRGGPAPRAGAAPAPGVASRAASGVPRSPRTEGGAAELLLKVKEPLEEEVDRLRENQALFTFLHLAAAPELAARLVRTGATCIAYETVEDERGGLPLLAAMSSVAGRLGAQAGAWALCTPHGGRGVLIGGVPGVLPAEVLVIGGGVAGSAAAEVAAGMGARVTIADVSPERLRELDVRFGRRVRTLHSSALTIEEMLPGADLVIGAVLRAGARAPYVLRRGHLDLLRAGSVLVDISIDQGGCFETSHPTTHRDPTFCEGGVVHYCVTNMPAAVPVTSTRALTAATLRHVVALADHGIEAALARDPLLARGLNVAQGRVVHPAVRKALDAHGSAATYHG